MCDKQLNFNEYNYFYRRCLLVQYTTLSDGYLYVLTFVIFTVHFWKTQTNKARSINALLNHS